jgi:hypothetical protein
VKEATVRKWIRDRELAAILFHREWRVSVRHLEEFVIARLQDVRAGTTSDLASPDPHDESRALKSKSMSGEGEPADRSDL